MVPVIMPKLEMSQETATVVEWLKHEGDAVRQGEPLLIVQTEKVETEVEAPASGILAAITATAGQVVAVTTVIAQLMQPGEAADQRINGWANGQISGESAGAHLAAVGRGAPAVTPVAQRMAQEHTVDLRQVVGTGPGGRIVKADVEAALRATPAARRVARAAGLDLATVPGAGPRGRIQEADVRRAADAPSLTGMDVSAGSAGGPEKPAQALIPGDRPTSDTGQLPAFSLRPASRLVPLTGVRAVVAQRMTQSYQAAPHIHLSLSVDVTAAEATRGRWAEVSGAKVSLTVLLVKACAWALHRHPVANATVEGEGLRLWEDVNIGVAVALPAGLIVPVLRRADRRPVGELAAGLADMAARARAGALRPDEVTGGTFTLTNLGMFGIEAFDPILNPPQVAILGVGAAVPTPVTRDGAVVTRPMMQLTLAADHRGLDGAVAAAFLQDIQRAIHDPALMLA